MHPLFETREILQIIVEYIGFSPSRFYLKECSRYLYHEISGVVHLEEADFLEALDRKLVNRKYLRLKDNPISDDLIDKVYVKFGYRCRTYALDTLLQDRSIDEIMNLGRESLKRILRCSVVRLNIAVLDIALKCMKARGYITSQTLDFLYDDDFNNTLMETDALLILKKIFDFIPPDPLTFLCKHLLLSAIKFRARRCEKYLQGFTGDWTQIRGMLEAQSFAGNLKQVKTLCSPVGQVAIETIHSALQRATLMRHLDVASFLRDEYERRRGKCTAHQRMALIGSFVDEMRREPRPRETKRLWDKDLSIEFLNWLFEGINNIGDWQLSGLPLLNVACVLRSKTMCHFLVDRGCTSITVLHVEIELEKEDLLTLLDLCCDAKRYRYFTDDPLVQMFLVSKGIIALQDPVFEVLVKARTFSTISNRVELIKRLLVANPRLATKLSLESFQTSYNNCSLCEMTPLGFLELFGAPVIEIWTGKTKIELPHFRYFDQDKIPVKDDWKLTRPNEVEIQALWDVREALIQHGADPGLLFAPEALARLFQDGGYVSAEFIRRLVHGRADVNHKFDDGSTPLTRAVQSHPPVDVIRALLEAGASLESGCAAQNVLWIALRTSAAKGNQDILRLILDRKANPNILEKEPNGLTPLSWILSQSCSGRFKVAEVLLEYKADINARDSEGITVTFREIIRGDSEAVDWLIEHGAGLPIVDDRGAGSDVVRRSRRLLKKLKRDES